jgi:hypothetical protein
VTRSRNSPPPAVGALPAMAGEVSGRIYRFGPNPSRIASPRIDFDRPDEAGFAMTFHDGQPPRQGRVGLDGVLRMFPGEDGMTAGMRGSWTSAQDFVAEYDGIAAIDAIDLALHFEGDRVVVTAKDRTCEAGITLEGRAE